MDKFKIGDKVWRNPKIAKVWAKDKHPLTIVEINPVSLGKKLNGWYRVQHHDGDTTVYMQRELIAKRRK